MKIKHKLKHQIHLKRNKHPEQVGVRILAKSRNVNLFDREIHYLSLTLLASSTQMDTMPPSFLLTFPFTKRIYFHINTLPKNYCRLCMYGRQTRSPIKINIKRFTNPLIITYVVPPNIIRASNNQYNRLKWAV